jgi:hypothetical protein
MGKKRYTPYLFGIILLLMVSTITPIFAEVTTLQIDSKTSINNQIGFFGTVEKGSNGLVTIVIRDFNEEFIMLTQTQIDPDYSFKKTIDMKNKFSELGMYNATGFILNMTKGVMVNFEVTTNGIHVDINEKPNKVILIEPIEKSVKEVPVKLPKEIDNMISNSRIANFVDSSKDPQYYVDRYYNEKSYKSWFDRNYPQLTIEQAVGINNEITEDITEVKIIVQEIITKEIIPKAEALSVQNTLQPTNNAEIAQISVAIAALGILFGTVYGVKRNVDNNSRQISINRDTIRRRIIQPLIGSNPKEIIQTRLAKGDITLEEYEKIKSKLD